MELFKTPFFYDPALNLYYRMENDVLDSSANGYDGTFIGAPSYISGKFGNTVGFTSDSTYINVPTAASIATLANVTVAFWYKVVGTPTSQYHTPYFEGNSSSPPPQVNIVVNANNGVFSGKLSIVWRDDSGATAGVFTGNTLINDGLFHFVCVRIKADAMTAWVDGVQDGGISGTRPTGTYTINEIRVGRGGSFNNNQAFDSTATMDDLAVFTRALSDTEMKLIYYGSTGAGLLGMV